VAPTDSVRLPGTPISSLPFTISQAGHYYVTRNLTGASGQNGITVAADDASIDLGGFVLSGSGGTGYGIVVNTNVAGTRITNGVLKAWQVGVAASGSGYTTISDLQSRGNAQGGIIMSAHGSIERCNVSGNGYADAASGYGLRVSYTAVRDCVVTDNKAYGLWSEGAADISGIYARNNGSSDVLIVGLGTTLRDSHVCGLLTTGDGGITTTGGSVIIDNTLSLLSDFSGGSTFLPYIGVAGLPSAATEHTNVGVACQ
jgi:hypothetical protein